jgi:ABC-2 type transport system permease protein
MFLPKFVQQIAVALPPYHLSQLAFRVIGYGPATSPQTHWEALVGFAMICLGIAWAGHQRDQKANG